jgi:hypothetical protein
MIEIWSQVRPYLFELQPLFRLWLKFSRKLDLVYFGCDPYLACNQNSIARWTLFVLGVTLVQITTEIRSQIKPCLFLLWPMFILQPKFDYKLDLGHFYYNPYPDYNWNLVVG